MTQTLLAALTEAGWLAAGLGIGLVGLVVLRHIRAQREANEWDPY
jgi:hypothetical protein